jgi:ankyrin repeat protein
MLSGGGFTADMVNRGGHWTLTPNSRQALSQADAPSCSEVPYEQAQADPGTRARAACQSFFSGVGAASLDTARSFLAAGLDLNNCRGPAGRTPLMVASAGYLETVRLFVERGANVNLKDANGNTAMAYAQQYARQFNPGTLGGDEAEAIMRVLRRAGAQ